MADIHTLDIAGQRDDELLSRLIDGECSTDERLDLEVRLATDPALRARLEEFRANDAAFKAVIGAQDSTVNTGVSDRLANYIARDDRASSPIYKFAVAATLLLATAIVTVSNLWTSPLSDTPQIDAVLAKALSTEPSAADGWSNVDDERALRVVLTFPAADGQWCREFLLASDDSHWRGVACKGAKSWVTQVIGREVFLEQQGGYRTASAETSHPIEQFIDQTATDIALSADQEAALIAQDWSSSKAH
ncbi:anti-sigma factor family protein [Luminiphilus sp. nBUS_16]|uniref:anti-sigma factor family protein n=1 Tax=Luminiphilus sp. nBUS_16 TaxID=3395315 RepID=UPI003EB83A7C